MRLGIGSLQQDNSMTQGLEVEVDTYLAGLSSLDVDSVAFWEVC
jgi:hypothetical protein